MYWGFGERLHIVNAWQDVENTIEDKVKTHSVADTAAWFQENGAQAGE